MNLIPIHELCIKAQNNAKDLLLIENMVDYILEHQRYYSVLDLHRIAECIEEIIRQTNKRDVRTFKIALHLVDIRFK